MDEQDFAKFEFRVFDLLHKAPGILGVVSLTFRELYKIISQKYAMPEITFMVRISSWNLLPKHGFGHTYTVSAWNFHKYDFLNT